MPTFNITQAAGPLNTAATPKPKGVRLSCDPKSDPDVTGFHPWFFQFLFKRYTTSGDAAADTNGTVVYQGANSVHLDSAELTKGTSYWYNFYWIDIYGNVSAAGTVRSTTYRGTNDGDVDKTLPGTPTLNSLTQVAKNTDSGDGRIEIAVIAAYSAPGSGVEVKRYIVEVSDGTDTYTYYSKKLSRKFPAVAGKTYTVKVSAESIFGEEGSQSTSLNITPTGKTGAPSNVTSVSIVVKALGNRIKWTPPSDKDLAGANVYFNTVNNSATATLLDFTDATKYDDTVARAAGTNCYYFVEAVNRSGVVSSSRVAASNNPQVSRVVVREDISPGEVIPSKLYRPPTTNAVVDPEMLELENWKFEETSLGGVALPSGNRVQSLNPSSDNRGSSYYKWRMTATVAARPLWLESNPFTPVDAGFWYEFGLYVEDIGNTIEVDGILVLASWWGVDGSGNLTLISQVGQAIGGIAATGYADYASTILKAPAGAKYASLSVEIDPILSPAKTADVYVSSPYIYPQPQPDSGQRTHHEYQSGTSSTFGTGGLRVITTPLLVDPDSRTAKMIKLCCNFRQNSGSTKTIDVEFQQYDGGTWNTLFTRASQVCADGVPQSIQWCFDADNVGIASFLDLSTTYRYGLLLTSSTSGATVNQIFLQVDQIFD